MIYNNETECNIVSPSIIRNNYDGIGYALENSSKEVIWNPNTSKIINENKTYYAITKSSDSWIATFIKGSAKTISKESASCYKYNNEATCEVTAPTFELNDNYSKDGLVKVSGSATPDKVSENGIITLTTSSTYKTNIDAIVEIPTTQNCVDTTYDGTSKTLLTGTNYTLENNIKINAGTYEITAKLNNDSVWKDGTKEDKKISCEIKKRDVTYKADNNSKVYDGSALTKQTATLTSGILASNQNATFDITGTITNVGSVTNTLNGVTIKQDGTDVSSNYNITKVNGTLTVTRATTSTLGSCGNLTYNGSSQNLVTGGNEVTVTNNTGTDAKTYTVNVESTGNYAFSDGTTSKTLTCEIKKRDVTIKADSDSRAYNESALTKETATLTSGTLVSGHVATSNITGTITDVGSVTNTLNSVVIKDATSNDVTSNYNITKVNGTLTVTKAPTTIPTNTLCVSKTYDGTTQQLTSTTSGTGYTLSNYNQTNAGNYTITATLNSNYKWNDNSETTKSFSCSMSKRDVTYKADNNSKVYDGSALTKNTGTLTSGTLVSGHVATSNITGTITDVGSVTNTLNSVVIKDATSNDVTSNYNITKVNGTLTVNKKDVTVSANTISKVYDGNALTSSICSGNDLVSGQNVTCTMTSASTITNVGNTPNIIDTTIIKSSTTDVTSNYNITKTNGTLTITPANFINNSVLITGIVVNGNTLTATPASNPTGTYSYQWWTSIDSTGTTKTNITNATSNTYKITQNEVGKYIGVTLTISKDNYITTTINKITNLVGDFNCSINGNPTEWTKTATLTGTISNGVQAYSWTNSTTTPTSWTNSTNTTQTKNITENNNYYLHIKSDNDNVKYCSVNVQKIDNEGPTITNLELTTNDKTITATITANDNDKSGVTKYYYSLDGEVYTESTNNNYTFTNLTYGETYTIYTYVKDALNNESIVSNSEITISIPCPEGSTLTNGYCTKLATVIQTCDSGTLSGTTCLKTATSSYTCTGVGGSLSGSNCWTSTNFTGDGTYVLYCRCGHNPYGQVYYSYCDNHGKTYSTQSACNNDQVGSCPKDNYYIEDYSCSANGIYTCSSGWTKSGTQCYKEAATSYSCAIGWTKSGTTCIKTSTPVYSCEEGWTLSGTTCTKLPG